MVCITVGPRLFLLKSIVSLYSNSLFRAAGTYFNMVRTDLLEMDTVAPFYPLPPPTILPPYSVYYSDFYLQEIRESIWWIWSINLN